MSVPESSFNDPKRQVAEESPALIRAGKFSRVIALPFGLIYLFKSFQQPTVAGETPQATVRFEPLQPKEITSCPHLTQL